jgi:hypothetical protein
MMQDEAVLIEILQSKNSMEDLRRVEELKAALANCTDERRLVELALGDKSAVIRDAADKKLHDRSAYFKYDIALHDPLLEHEKRALNSALMGIHDKDIVFNIAKTHPSADVRYMAAVQLDYDDARRKEIARTDPDPLVRRDLVYSLFDEQLLEEIAANDPDERVREQAKYTLHHPISENWYYLDSPADPW